MTDEGAARLPVQLDARALERMRISKWRTEAGDVDVMVDMPHRTVKTSAAVDRSDNPRLRVVRSLDLWLLVGMGDTLTSMSEVAVDRRATREEVLGHRDRLRDLAGAAGLSDPRVGPNGVVIAHPPDNGYRATLRFARDATAVVGAWVQTIADDAPAAEVVAEPL